MDWILEFLDPDSCCLQQDQEWLLFAVSRAALYLDFVFAEKNVGGCLF